MGLRINFCQTHIKSYFREPGLKKTHIMKLKLASAAILSIVVLTACGDKKTNGTKVPAATKNTENTGSVAGPKLAYVNADTLNKHYQYLKDKEAAFEKKQNAYEAEMSSKEKALQNEYMAFQKKAQEGTLTQSEGEAAQKRLSGQQQALEKRHQAISAEMAKEQMAIQEEFQKKLDEFLASFNKERNYDFIFTYSKNGGPILFANSALDITQEVLEAMNENYKNGDGKKDDKVADKEEKK